MKEQHLNKGINLKINKFDPNTGEFLESIEFINGDKMAYRLDRETRIEIIEALTHPNNK